MYDECFLRIGGGFTKLDFIHSRPAISSSSSAAEAYYIPLMLHTQMSSEHPHTCNIKIMFMIPLKRMAFYIARTKGQKWFQLITGTF